MKRAVLTLFLTFSVIAPAVFAQTYDLDFDIIGVYLPVEYIETLNATKHNPAAWSAFTVEFEKNTVFIVDAYSVEACNLSVEVQYRVFIWDILNFSFENINDDIYLTDGGNNRYMKIPGNLYDYEYWGDLISNYVSSVILSELIETGDIILEKGLITFPALDNKVFIAHWQAFNSEDRMNLILESVTGNQYLSLEIKSNEYIFYGYYHFPTDIVWSKCYGEIDGFPAEDDFYGVWVNELDVTHIINADEWIYLSPNGSSYTISGLEWTKFTNYDITSASDYKYGYSITGTITSIRFNYSHTLIMGAKRTVSYFIHNTDKTKIVIGNNPEEAAFFNKVD